MSIATRPARSFGRMRARHKQGHMRAGAELFGTCRRRMCIWSFYLDDKQLPSHSPIHTHACTDGHTHARKPAKGNCSESEPSASEHRYAAHVFPQMGLRRAGQQLLNDSGMPGLTRGIQRRHPVRTAPVGQRAPQRTSEMVWEGKSWPLNDSFIWDSGPVTSACKDCGKRSPDLKCE